ncbi:MarR family transcriptional regulator [Pseudoalteromonas sp. NBT06-2]|uniref:MarR family winged helix-turn-helix transcriptional regulator n=1 Tax=Pseudoalteromonas sp. NBT06-2 TaxID=2025950 RepID=UPI000BA5AB3E|nr:MarR family transcriptional regulator [Pseudoalteromonas sp. NBT06-2]PAJ72390.1 MarR family transcriptional regulator [Pseudoalteromonas sp. NBT06-2]
MKTQFIYHTIERLGELLKIAARKAGAEYGLQPVQLEVLHYLSVCNRYSDTLMAVTEYLGQTKGTVSQTIKILEKKQLLDKISDLKDKRVSHLKITPKAIALIKDKIPTTMFINASNHLSLTQQQGISSTLQLLLTTLIQSNNMKSFGHCFSCRYNAKSGDSGYFCNLVKEPLTEKDVLLICREHLSNK